MQRKCDNRKASTLKRKKAIEFSKKQRNASDQANGRFGKNHRNQSDEKKNIYYPSTEKAMKSEENCHQEGKALSLRRENIQRVKTGVNKWSR